MKTVALSTKKRLHQGELNMQKLSGKENMAIGLMLFALFFGAGNMIFPPALGQAAGSNVWGAILGFLITGVGLPLLGVTAIALAGESLEVLSGRISPKFGILFTVVMYLAIGPFFGIPRTGTVAFEIGIKPFLSENLLNNGFSLFIFTIFFFTLTFILSLNPSKLVDRIGKIITPALLVVLTILVVKGIVSPMGEFSTPTEAYQTTPFFKGFIEGYLTLDAIAALVFGIVVINAIKERGITDKKSIAAATIKAGLIAAVGLAVVYISLGYLGATSLNAVGEQANGGALTTAIAYQLFGLTGNVLLGFAILFATLTTSVGLVSSAAGYFSKLLPKLSYPVLVGIFSIFSLSVANVGLTQLISITLPVLIGIYPLAITLIAISFAHKYFNGYSEVYAGGMIGAFLVSVVDGFATAGFPVQAVTEIYSFLPLYSQGIGWLVPAITGSFIGFAVAKLKGKTVENVNNLNEI